MNSYDLDDDRNPFKGLGMEAIAYQSGRLFQDLTEAIGKIRRGRRYDRATVDSYEIPKTIFLHTGMKVDFYVDQEVGENAWAMFPMMDKNHPFMHQWVDYVNSAEGLSAIRALGGEAVGEVDLKASRVGGIYSHMEVKTALGAGLLRNSSYTDAEIAGIVCHELGHLFTYFEFLGSYVMTSHIIAGVCKQVMETEDYNKRVVILKEASKTLGVSGIDEEKLARTPKMFREVLTSTVFISEIGRKTRSETGASIYEMRSVEQLADQFAARHGAGRDMASGLEKLFSNYGHESTMSTTQRTCFEIVKVLMFVLQGSVITIGMGGIGLVGFIFVTILVMMSTTEKIYDDPEARIKLIRQTVEGELRNRDTPPARKKEILDDIMAIKLIEGRLKDRRTILEWIWTTLLPGKKAKTQQDIAKDLEALLHNDMFAMSARFELQGEE